MRLALRPALLCAALLALIVADGPAEAAFPGQNGKIAFTSDRDGTAGGDIFLADSDGSGVTRVRGASMNSAASVSVFLTGRVTRL